MRLSMRRSSSWRSGGFLRIDLQTAWKRYQYVVKRLPPPFRHIALILAPRHLSVMVLLVGLVRVVASLSITACLIELSLTSELSRTVSFVLATSFTVQSLSFIIKERQESLLVAAVQQLTFLRFRALFARSMKPSEKQREWVLTFPDQIGQFAYVLDAIVGTFEILAFLVLVVWFYEFSGLLAIALIAAISMASVRLIHKIGRLWACYLDLEGERRAWIERIAVAMPRGRFMPTYRRAIDELRSVRERMEGVLRRRVGLQVMNGYVDRCALTSTLCVVLVVEARFWPQSAIGLGIIVAAQYLYSSVQNNLANYRVIRLALPMMQKLGALEDGAEDAQQRFAWSASDEPRNDNFVQILACTPDTATALRIAIAETGGAYVPQNPTLSQAVLSAWHRNAGQQQNAEFLRLAAEMGLSRDAVRRLWRDCTTLSSGEAQRVVLGLVLSERPSALVLENIFAVLDPDLRESVAAVVRSNAREIILLAASPEYIPEAFIESERRHNNRSEAQLSVKALSSEGRTSDLPLPVAREVRSPASGEDHSVSPPEALGALPPVPDPDPRKSMFLRAGELLFGPYSFLLLLGAMLIVGSEIAFAFLISDREAHRASQAIGAAGCLAACVGGCLMFYGVIYRVPIRRLTVLHHDIASRMPRFAHPHTKGAVVGRMGDDFSFLQMSVPSAMGSILLGLIKSLLLIVVASAGVPMLLAIILLVTPVVFLAARAGTRRILLAQNSLARSRDTFLAAVIFHSRLDSAPLFDSLARAEEEVYRVAQTRYVDSAIALANSYAYRSAIIQGFIMFLNITALCLELLFGQSSLVGTTLTLYFVMTFSSAIQSTVEAIQNGSVVGMRVERVRMLKELNMLLKAPVPPQELVSRICDTLAQGKAMVALIGPSGSGKSSLLHHLCKVSSPGSVALVPDVNPFEKVSGRMSGVQIAREEALHGTASLLLLDETFRALTPEEERFELEWLRQALISEGKQAVVALHSRSSLDCFDDVLVIEG